MRLLLLVPFLALACASTSDVEPVLGGRITLRGRTPTPSSWDLDEPMIAVAHETRYVDELWLVEDGGVANCVVTLEPIGHELEPLPAQHVLFEKVGIRYEPRVLVIPVGSEVTLKNRNSPCRGFRSSTFGTSFNTMLTVGMTKEVLYPRAIYAPVVCDMRPYMKGAIVAVDTPYFAKTDRTGAFEIGPVEPGEYEVRVWHEALGRKKLVKQRLVFQVGKALPPLEIQLSIAK